MDKVVKINIMRIIKMTDITKPSMEFEGKYEYYKDGKRYICDNEIISWDQSTDNIIHYSEDIIKKCKNAGLSDREVVSELSRAYDNTMSIIRQFLEQDISNTLLK